MTLKIIQIGHPVLRKQAKPLSQHDIANASIQQLIQATQETMYAAPGVGLAAPQIGESLQLAVIEDRAEYLQHLSAEEIQLRDRKIIPFHVLINPVLTINSHETVEFYEGCLSVAGLVGLVPRAKAVTVEYVNEQGQPMTIQASGWYARILQHEIDHLHGTLCIDCMHKHTITTIENYQTYVRNQS